MVPASRAAKPRLISGSRAHRTSPLRGPTIAWTDECESGGSGPSGHSDSAQIVGFYGSRALIRWRGLYHCSRSGRGISSFSIGASWHRDYSIGAFHAQARNQLPATIKSVKLGNVMAEVVMAVGGVEIVSAITRGSAEAMGLKAGDSVKAIIKSTEVMIDKS